MSTESAYLTVENGLETELNIAANPVKLTRRCSEIDPEILPPCPNFAARRTLTGLSGWELYIEAVRSADFFFLSKSSWSVFALCCLNSGSLLKRHSKDSSCTKAEE